MATVGAELSQLGSRALAQPLGISHPACEKESAHKGSTLLAAPAISEAFGLNLPACYPLSHAEIVELQKPTSRIIKSNC